MRSVIFPFTSKPYISFCIVYPSGDAQAGQYKRSDNLILEVDEAGRRSVRFRPTPAAETPAAMEQLELAYLEARSGAKVLSIPM